MTNQLEALAAQLDASPDYRVLRRFVPPSRYHEGDGSATARGVVVDVETTGLDTVRDRIIEFCGVPFEFEKESGRILAVEEPVTFLQDPGRPIPAEVTRLTGITDDMVAGKAIDEEAVGAMLADVGLVIAHNAGFDRPFVDRRLAGVQGQGVGLFPARGAVEGLGGQFRRARVPDDEAVRTVLRRAPRRRRLPRRAPVAPGAV